MEEGLLSTSSPRDPDCESSSSSITFTLLLSTFIAGCASFTSGCVSGYSSPAESGIVSDLGLTTAQFSFFGSILTIGGMVGALISGKLADLAGRRSNFRPSAEELPEELAAIVTSCWKEDPHARPNFTQIIQMLLRYLSTVAPPEPAIPQRIFKSDNAIFPPESPGTSSLMMVRDHESETPKTPMENERRGLFFCFSQCY